ncbi:hypothetical protein KY289_013290 [Solanum tuberosum]|nr:hypothetical protein KY289_013290 [Solanum tuberosum]
MQDIWIGLKSFTCLKNSKPSWCIVLKRFHITWSGTARDILVSWTCRKTGHKASECRSGAKKKKINLLGMDEETKGKLLAILDEPFSESAGTSDEYSDDEGIDLDYNSDKSQSGKDCTCIEAFCTCDSTPHIQVLSDHSKEALFDVIQHINDSESRNHFLLELKNVLLNTDKPKPRPIIEPFRMKQIMNRSDNHSEPSISDLHHETDILTNQVPKRTTFQDMESDQDSSNDDNIDVIPSNINNDHLVEPFVTNTGNDTSTSVAPGVTDEIRIKKIGQILETPEIVTKIANLQKRFEEEIFSSTSASSGVSEEEGGLGTGLEGQDIQGDQDDL